MKTGLVLSGGAAWGLANIGVLDVLEQEKIRIDCIAGSSMGAIIAGLFAYGVSVPVLRSTAEKLSLLKIAKFSGGPMKDGLHSGIFRHQLEEILSPLIGNAVIGDCKIPFVCVAGRVRNPLNWTEILQEGFTDEFEKSIEPVVFSQTTKLLDAFLATSALPIIFSPVTIGHDSYIDLVHFGAVPARKLREICHPDIVIGTDTNPRYGILHRFLPHPWREFLDRGQHQLQMDLDACDLVIKPRMPAPVFRFDRAIDFIKAGRGAAEQSVPELRGLLDQ